MLRARRAPRRCDVAAAMRFGRARLSALRRGFPRAALGCTRFGPGRASREREERALPDHHSRLSQAPGTPTVMSRGSIPGPPGSGVCRSARRNRTRSALKSTLAKGIPQERAARPRRHRRTIVKFAVSMLVEPLILRHFFFAAGAARAGRRRSLGVTQFMIRKNHSRITRCAIQTALLATLKPWDENSCLLRGPKRRH